MKKMLFLCLALTTLNSYANNNFNFVYQLTHPMGNQCPRCCVPWDPNPCCIKC